MGEWHSHRQGGSESDLLLYTQNMQICAYMTLSMCSSIVWQAVIYELPGSYEEDRGSL